MANTSTNFIAGKMNKSVDERLVPPGEYIDALNVRLGSTENTEIGAVENSKGNSILTNVQFSNQPLSSSARTIGVYEDGINETIYWFVHDENNTNSPTGKVDLILSYNTSVGSLTYHVISTSVLNFDKKYLITGVNKIEDLLFFTDNLNPPRVINVIRQPGYAYPVSGIDTILVEEDLKVIVKPPGYEYYDTALVPPQIAPLGSPHIEPYNLAGEENYMETRFISFAYRYRYEDGGYSATSLFTTSAFQPEPFKFSVQNFNNPGMRNKYNACRVYFSTGSKRVKEVDLLYKQSGSNVINVIKRYNKQDLGWADDNVEVISFTNSEIYTTLGSDELLRLYDNVPHVAQAQTIKGNRLIYGNYKDGYDIQAVKGGSILEIDYKTTPVFEDIAGTSLADPTTQTDAYTIGPGNPGLDAKITFDLTAANPISGPIVTGTSFYFIFSLETIAVECSASTPPPAPPSGWDCNTVDTAFAAGFPVIDISMTFTTPQDYTDVTAMCASQEFKDRIGGSLADGYSNTAVVQELYPCNNSSIGSTLSDAFYAANPAIYPNTDLALVNGSRDTSCSVSLFPANCATTILISGTTDAAVAGFLTDSAVDFVAAGVVTGDVITDISTGLTATVGASVTANALELVGGGSGVADLEASGTSYNVVNASVSPAACAPDGFTFSPTVGGFSLAAPATQYYYSDGSGSNTVYQYYAFLGYGSSAGYLKTANTQSLHSNRDYETGIVYMDGYGRSSTVLVSPYNTTYFNPAASITKNSIKIELSNLPPYWAKKYKFVVKPSQGDYQTIYCNTFYSPDGTGVDPSNVENTNDPTKVWFKLEGTNQSLIKTGDDLIVKVDSSGALLTEQITTVLDVRGFSNKAITNTSLKGLYMLLKPSGWTTANTQTSYFFPTINKLNTTGNASNSCINNYSLNDPTTGLPYDIPAGSTIRIKIHSWRGGGSGSCNSMSCKFDKTFMSTDDYPSFWHWASGDDLVNQLTTANATVDQMTIGFNPTLTGSTSCGGSFDHINCQIRESAPGGPQFFMNSGGIKRCWDIGGKFPGHNSTLIEVTRGGGMFVFETIPQDADPNLFYDASDLLEIKPLVPGGQPYHMAPTVYSPTGDSYSTAPGGTDQGPGQDLVMSLNAYNCYTFGNGVESYRIGDSPAGKAFTLGERTLAVSNQDFKEAHRFAGMTYSGVYSGAANSNNLNEFNLGLLNYKDCETSFGPIQLLHARETDILTLQEDRISYVLVDKNVITDSTGGGAIASVPEVLGTQVARIEEYGISFNPESFVAWGYDMFFTDTKRGAVLNLRGASANSDQLQVVSKYGMNSWFRDQFNDQLTTQKLGGYDPYMQEYVLSTNNQSVPVPIPLIPCGQTLTQYNSSNTVEYEASLGTVIGQVDIPYSITSGSITINVTWNGTVYTSGSVSSSGSFSFDKTSSTPSIAEVEIIPASSSTYGVTLECPPEVPLTVIQVVVNSSNYAGESITTSYNWSDGSTVSPSSTLPAALVVPQPSEYQLQTGVRSVGIFPYDGANITLRTQKIAPDNFDFDSSIHKFKILSSNTLYTSSSADISALLADPNTAVVSGAITSPSSGTFQATQTAFNMPVANQYLYLIWDLRLINSKAVCYCPSPSSNNDVCCTCSVGCDTVFCGPNSTNSTSVCFTNTNSFNNLGEISFNGLAGGLPTIGDVCFPNTGCDGTAGYLPTGYYIVGTSSPVVGTKKWIEIGANGVVIDEGNC
jgi:hypothetical protein